MTRRTAAAASASARAAQSTSHMATTPRRTRATPARTSQSPIRSAAKVAVYADSGSSDFESDGREDVEVASTSSRGKGKGRASTKKTQSIVSESSASSDRGRKRTLREARTSTASVKVEVKAEGKHNDAKKEGGKYIEVKEEDGEQQNSTPRKRRRAASAALAAVRTQLGEDLDVGGKIDKKKGRGGTGKARGGAGPGARGKSKARSVRRKVAHSSSDSESEFEPSEGEAEEEEDADSESEYAMTSGSEEEEEEEEEAEETSVKNEDKEEEEDEDDLPVAAMGRSSKAKKQLQSKRKPAVKKAKSPKKAQKKASTPKAGRRTASSSSPRKTTKGKSPKKDTAGQGGGKRGRKNSKNEDQPASSLTPQYIAEYAKTGRAKCRRCYSLIPRGEVRVGSVLDHPDYGLTTYWRHLDCATVTGLVEDPSALEASLLRAICAADIQGFTELRDEDQLAVAGRLRGGQEASEWEAVDPDALVERQLVKVAEPPESLTASLLRFQKEALAWMCDQEESDFRGGILADEMGMGKTCQTIALLCARPGSVLQQEQGGGEGEGEGVCVNEAKGEGKAKSEGKGTGRGKGKGGSKSKTQGKIQGKSPDKIESQDKSKSPAHTQGQSRIRGVGSLMSDRKRVSHGTLVICPLVAVVQWKNEIARFTQPGTLRVCVFHGAGRSSLEDKLHTYDVVLTTYSIAEVEYRKVLEPAKLECSWCGRKFLPDRLAVHRRYFCGPDAERTEKQAKTQKKKARSWATQMRDADKEEEEEEWRTSDGSDDDSEEDLKKMKKKKKKEKKTKGKGGSGRSGGSSKGGDYNSKKKVGGAKKGLAGSKAVGKVAAGKKGKHTDGGTDKRGGRGKGGSLGQGQGGGRGRRGRKRAADAEEEVEDEAEEQGSSSKNGTKNKAASQAVGLDEVDLLSSALHRVHWARIVLDEAHYVKDRRCSTAKSVFALSSEAKWCLTGTPLQNRIGELYSLIRFLRMDPYAYYFCRTKGCDCKSMEYRFGKEWRECVSCGHSPIQHYSDFNRKIVNPIKNFGYVGEGRHAMMMLKEHVLDQVLLRRTKEGRAEDICLPPKIVRIRRDVMSEREEDFYQAIYTQSRAQFDTYVEGGVVLNNYAHIFDLLMRLRQAVDHPYLVIHSNTATAALGGAPSSSLSSPSSSSSSSFSSSSSSGGDSPTSVAEQESACAICFEVPEDVVTAGCGHDFCRACLMELVASAETDLQVLCPTCDSPITADLASSVEGGGEGGRGGGGGGGGGRNVVQRRRKSFLDRLDVNQFQSSSKIEALMEELTLMEEEDPSGKAIVFSQFVNMLDLIEHRLRLGGIKCVKLSGHMSMEVRDRAIKSFTKDPSVKVFLISLKAGGVALNLTVANRCMLMDPWWNPAGEMQAIDRTHRLGQFKPIRATRFVIANTIEDRILRLQEKKRLIFEGTVGQNQAALGKLTEEDLRFLFS